MGALASVCIFTAMAQLATASKGQGPISSRSHSPVGLCSSITPPWALLPMLLKVPFLDWHLLRHNHQGLNQLISKVPR